jgi:DNA-binding MarR family transcriptional regulator
MMSSPGQRRIQIHKTATMKTYALLHQLVDLVEEFENGNKQHSQFTLEHFTGFLNNKITAKNKLAQVPDVRLGKNEMETQKQAYQLDNNIGRHFVYMSRYAKSYIKKALEGTALHTAEEFTCLSILFTHDHLSKTDLINRNLQEKTSGTEVIKRLITNGLATQWDDEHDRRGKRIAITPRGKEQLHIVFKDMNHVGKMVTGNLSFEEKLNLKYLLQKLDDFHYQLHEDKTIATKEDLRSWTLTPSTDNNV